MLRKILLLLTVALLFAVRPAAAEPKPLKALLIAGGCCHDYAKQKDLLKQGIEQRANVEVTIVYTPDHTTKARFDIYEKPDWAKGYDVVIHDECTSAVTDMPYVQNILNAHRNGVPAVNLHCAMHCYRVGTNDWFDFVGIQSTGHGPQLPIGIEFINKDHPITHGLSDWTTIKEELYNNVKVLETAQPLARGKQKVEKGVSDFVVAWTNQYGKTRVFSTTIGHNNDTVADDRYLDLITRGLLWSCDKLSDEYLRVETK